ncbi:hypothetical protein KY284_030210 [Solanum tuberosum]|nr:hypothetical protein KY284_030210 [Solanum tuberosum]
MTIYKFSSLNNIFEAANVVEQELKEEKDFKKPYENTPFEGNTPKYPPREEGNKDPTKFPKGIQFHKCRGWGHMTGVDQEKGCEEETREEDEFEGDEDEEQDPCERKHVVVPNGLMMKTPTEEAWSQEGEFTVPCIW